MYTLLILFLILYFGYPYCKKVTFDNNYRYNAISIELYPIELMSAVQKAAFRAFKQI